MPEAPHDAPEGTAEVDVLDDFMARNRGLIVGVYLVVLTAFLIFVCAFHITFIPELFYAAIGLATGNPGGVGEVNSDRVVGVLDWAEVAFMRAWSSSKVLCCEAAGWSSSSARRTCASATPSPS